MELFRDVKPDLDTFLKQPPGDEELVSHDVLVVGGALVVTFLARRSAQ